MKVKVRVFAGLKDYFDQSFEVEISDPTIAAVRNELLKKNPESAPLMELCRYAAGTEFAEAGDTINEGEVISFLPPSSGG